MKVLVISHNSFSTYENMGITFTTLFSEFKPEMLCQLYTFEQHPDIGCAESYYKLSDVDLIHKILHMKNASGIVYPDYNTHSYGMSINGISKQYQKKNNKNSLKVLLRDVLWTCGKWYDSKLKEWVNKQKPDVIFLAPGRYKFIYNIALRISRDYSLPIIAYICDDYYFTIDGKNAFDRFENRLLKKKIIELFGRCQGLVTINDDLKKIYNEEFSVETTTIYTETQREISINRAVKSPQKIVYMGNLNYHRDVSICEMGKAIDAFNVKYGTELHLDVYSMRPTDDVLKSFSTIRSINYRGYLNARELNGVFNEAHAFVHTEAFNYESIKAVKYSVSTKIPDALASGRVLIAYGNKELSSINYLIEKDCALVATSEHELESVFYDFVFDFSKQIRIIDNSLKVAFENHKKGKSSKKLYEILERAVYS